METNKDKLLQKLSSCQEFSKFNDNNNSITFYNHNTNSYCEIEINENSLKIYADTIMNEIDSYFVVPIKTFLSEDFKEHDIYYLFDNLFNIVVTVNFRD
jgi:hypothetical protein